MQVSLVLATIILVAWQQNFCPVSGEVYFEKGSPHVQLTNGALISGAVKLSRDGRPFSSFAGIPYATVPERFQEPQAIVAPTWEGVLDATKPGPICPQLAFGGGDDGFGITGLLGEEECLNLNVHVPMNSTGKGMKGFAVLFWVHGGGFMSGAGSEYNPSFFMDEDVIFVTVNYRVGSLGFLSTGDNVIRGNNGMKDMVVALRWVQANIMQFGGDAKKVTIVGESAGGAAVHHLLLSPITKGLFQGAISQSGCALNPWAFRPNPRQIAVELATYLKCPTTAKEASDISSVEILTCLKELSLFELSKAQYAFKSSWPANFRSFYFVPTAEPKSVMSSLTPFQTESPIAILMRKDSELQEIPWMVGATEDEGAIWNGVIQAMPGLMDELESDWDRIAPATFDYGHYLPKVEEQAQVSQKLKEFYFGNKKISAETTAQVRNAYSDETFLHGIYRAALETASRGKRNPVYLYQFAYRGPAGLSFMSVMHMKGEEAEKVSHADDLFYQFDLEGLRMMPGAGGMVKPDTPEKSFSKHFVRLWASFAIHGEPKYSWGEGAFKKWKPISKKEVEGKEPHRWYRLEANPSSVEISQSVKDRMQFWDNVWSDHLTPSLIPGYKKTQEGHSDGKKTKTEL